MTIPKTLLSTLGLLMFAATLQASVIQVSMMNDAHEDISMGGRAPGANQVQELYLSAQQDDQIACSSSYDDAAMKQKRHTNQDHRQ